MQDRVLDRAAVHATPARLAIRDWLLVALAFASGMYEAIAFLSFGKVFTGFQTGNLVFLGVGVAGTRPPAGPDPVGVIISLVAFALGAMLVVWILKRVNPDEEVEDEDVFHVWPRRVSIALGVSLLVQIGFLAVWLATSPSTEATYIMLGLNAFALGMQMNAVRSLHVPGIATTAATATFISLASSVAGWSLTGPAARRLIGVLVSLAVSAFLADWMLSHAHAYAPLVPVVVIAAVIAVAATALKPEPRGQELAPTAVPMPRPAGQPS
jgi:uncharacterized membrane protein YoaK (UPF0700 family)